MLNDSLRIGLLNGFSFITSTGAWARAPLWEGCHEHRRYSRDTYPESYITEYTSIRRRMGVDYAGDIGGVRSRPEDTYRVNVESDST
jgi:hypothetical protein